MRLASLGIPPGRGRVLALDRLQAVADLAPRDVRLVVVDDGGTAVAANSLLLALTSEFFEGVLRSGGGGGGGAREVRLEDLSADDVRTVVAYSEGRHVPELPEVASLMRLQDRFLMPALRQECARLLRRSLSTGGWLAATRLAAACDMWELVADAAVWASRLPWRDLSSADAVQEALLGLPADGAGCHPPLPPPDCVAHVLSEADFLCASQKFELALKWAQRAGAGAGGAVFEALRADALAGRLWPSEVLAVLGRDADTSLLPRGLVADIAVGLADSAGSPVRGLPQHAGALSMVQRRSMAMVDASLSAQERGAGWYQMVLLLLPHGEAAAAAYFSAEVHLGAPGAEYHVYLNEETALSDWWRQNVRSGSSFLVAVRFRERLPPPLPPPSPPPPCTSPAPRPR